MNKKDRAREQDCCFFANGNCLCSYFLYGLTREKRKREDLLCSQCLKNKLVVFLKMSWGLLHEADNCCSQNICFLTSERTSIQNKMSEKVCECEGGSAVASPKEGSAEGSGKLCVAGAFQKGRRVWPYAFQNLSRKCVGSFKGILLKQIKWQKKSMKWQIQEWYFVWLTKQPSCIKGNLGESDVTLNFLFCVICHSPNVCASFSLL